MRDTIIHITAPYDSDHAPYRVVIPDQGSRVVDIYPITIGHWADSGQVRTIPATDDSPDDTVYSAIVPTDHIGHPIWPDAITPAPINPGDWVTCDHCGQVFCIC